jgi:heavy metal translocating P-type ATPase
MNVYLILSESGVLAAGQDVRETEIFQRSLAMGLVAQGGRGAPPRPQPEPPRLAGTPTQELLVQVSGMWCAACAWLIEHVLQGEPGVIAAQASFASDLVKVTYCPQYLPPQRVYQRIQSLGYGAREYSGEQEAAAAERRDLLLRLGLAAFLWANIMSLSLAIYARYFEPIAGSEQRYLPYVLLALATPSVFYCGWPILRLAWRGLVNRAIRMEVLLALGISAAYGYSLVQAVRGDKHLYFDTVSVIVMLVLAGKLIERGAKEKATRWITTLHSLTPNKARVLSDGIERFVSIQALAPGTVFLVKAGERIPADGTVIEGESHADESLLTGESAPVAKGPGKNVAAGSVNRNGVLQVRATRTAADSTLSQIIAQVERALSSRSPVERAVDRISRTFVPVVVALSLATFAGLCFLGYGVGASLMRSIAVLVIACPCALGLATPLAITSAMGAASRHGILISDGRVLETLPKVDVLVLDKTGTATDGKFSSLHQCDAEPGPRSEREALRLAASLERYSEHPLGEALVEAARRQGIALSDAAGIEIHKGAGVTGIVEARSVFIGNRRLLQSLGAAASEALTTRLDRWESEGATVSFYGWDHQVHGLFAYGDRLRSGAPELVAELQRQGIEVRLVSGDSEATTRWIASALGADGYSSEVLPEGKRAMVEQLQKQGRVVAMVGDGINDSPALAQADLGIAMGTGTDIAMKAAAAVLMNGALEKIPAILSLSQKTMRIVRQNLFWAFFYNTLGIVLAITGILNPILAAAAMLLSSACVIGNTMRLISERALASETINQGTAGEIALRPAAQNARA